MRVQDSEQAEGWFWVWEREDGQVGLGTTPGRPAWDANALRDADER